MIEFEKINLREAKEGLCLYDTGIGNELQKLDWIICALATSKDQVSSDGLYYLLEDIYQNLNKAIKLTDEEIIFKLHKGSGGVQ